jgi:hypothetical protein
MIVFAVDSFQLALGILWIMYSVSKSPHSSLPRTIGTSYYAVSLGLNILLTALIVIRLLIFRPILALIFIITYACDNPLNQVFLAVASAGQVAIQFFIPSQTY